MLFLPQIPMLTLTLSLLTSNCYTLLVVPLFQAGRNVQMYIIFLQFALIQCSISREVQQKRHIYASCHMEKSSHKSYLRNYSIRFTEVIRQIRQY